MKVNTSLRYLIVFCQDVRIRVVRLQQFGGYGADAYDVLYFVLRELDFITSNAIFFSFFFLERRKY